MGSGCEREPLDAKTPNDRLSVVVVGAKHLPLTSVYDFEIFSC